ncbi:hypothetical protein [Mucilaginibacter ginkgonis]|uniref:Uncharacterized protein n=1 Tax=Mucilaginibacter ginkgonis TaxID=2682091 RepID=A0A6I4I3C5_9SPHI|nr:hypothetical protein [Mucilaginibacter ginkgonis]QQL50757.1 hypothetical protein GO620_004670 [Mucilaginibacter ginkgonis]
MIKTLLNRFSKIWLIGCFLAVTINASGQTENDAIMIPKNYICPAFMYNYGSWDHYWEGTFNRDNANLGTVSTKMYTAAVVYGLTNNINLIAAAPYVATHATAGTLANQKGVQDLHFTLKYMPLETVVGGGVLSAYAIGSYSLPLTNYVADFLPMSIGVRSRTFSIRGMLDYQVKNFFITGSGQYNQRQDITIDRPAYYTTQLIYSNQVAMPNVMNYNGRLGYRSASFRAEAIVDNNTTLGGFDITKNNMPFPSNRMNATSLGLNFKYSFQSGLELSAGGSRVVAGRNVGQTTMVGGGIDYLFSLNKRKKTNKTVIKAVNEK